MGVGIKELLDREVFIPAADKHGVLDDLISTPLPVRMSLGDDMFITEDGAHDFRDMIRFCDEEDCCD